MSLLKKVRSAIKSLGDRVMSDRAYFALFRPLYLVANGKRRGSRTQFAVVGPSLFSASDPDGTMLHFCERTRMRIYHYPKGVKGRLAMIEAKYVSDSVAVMDADVVIDIGANIGEFSRAVVGRASRLVAIDPDPNVWEALSRNLGGFSNATVLQRAMSDADSQVEFYVSTKNADSSLVQPAQYSETVSLNAMRLDTLIEELGIERVDFLKLEAEGWEPEILAGAKRTLGITRKIAVDAGPERQGQTTSDEVITMLRDAGFEVSRRGDMVFGSRADEGDRTRPQNCAPL